MFINKYNKVFLYKEQNAVNFDFVGTNNEELTIHLNS